VFSTNGLHNYDMYIFQNFNGTGHRLTVQYDQYLVRLLQSVFSMAFLRCHQPRLGCVWKICMTSRPLALICVFLCTPMVLCGLSVLPRVLHARANRTLNTRKQYRSRRTDGPSSSSGVCQIRSGQIHIHIYMTNIQPSLPTTHANRRKEQGITL
jgi:hypothetical protein